MDEKQQKKQKELLLSIDSDFVTLTYPILFLDDEKYRHDLMEKHYPGNVKHVYNCVQFFKALRLPFAQYDEVWLDHDLGDFNDSDPVEGDGMVAAQMLAQALQEGQVILPLQIRVHSFNPPRAKQMVEYLNQRINTEKNWAVCSIYQKPFGEEFSGVLLIDTVVKSTYDDRQRGEGKDVSPGPGSVPAVDRSSGSGAGDDSGEDGLGESPSGGTAGPLDPSQGE